MPPEPTADEELRALVEAVREIVRQEDLTPPSPEPKVLYATVRDGGDELHIECRFSDGQKFAAISVDTQLPGLAQSIADFLNRSAGK